jgi:hypothetical protein
VASCRKLSGRISGQEIALSGRARGFGSVFNKNNKPNRIIYIYIYIYKRKMRKTLLVYPLMFY